MFIEYKETLESPSIVSFDGALADTVYVYLIC